MKTREFVTTYQTLCVEYAVTPDTPADFEVVIYKDEEGWHVGGGAAAHLTDEQWAPRTDEQAQLVQEATKEYFYRLAAC